MTYFTAFLRENLFKYCLQLHILGCSETNLVFYCIFYYISHFKKKFIKSVPTMVENNKF
jgi:hypothetical protein